MMDRLELGEQDRSFAKEERIGTGNPKRGCELKHMTGC